MRTGSVHSGRGLGNMRLATVEIIGVPKATKTPAAQGTAEENEHVLVVDLRLWLADAYCTHVCVRRECRGSILQNLGMHGARSHGAERSDRSAAIAKTHNVSAFA